MWRVVRLGDVLTERREIPDPDSLALGDIRIVSKIGFESGRLELRQDLGTKTGMILVRPGDLLLSGINAAKGAIAIYGAENSDAVAATIHYGAYSVVQEVADTAYVWWYLRSRPFREILFQSLPEGIKTELKSKRLLPIKIPLPPLAEQKRIVARVEALAAQIAEARSLREQVAQEAEALPLAVLSAFVREQTITYGSVRLEELLTEAAYGSSVKCDAERREGATPVLRIPNVASERITLSDLKYARLSERDKRRLALLEGDILVVRTNGSLELVGRSAVVPRFDEPFAFASYMIRLRFDKNRLQSVYAQRMLQNLRVAGVLVDFARTTAGQYNVSLGRLRSAEIPVPPLPTQRRIVEYLARLDAQVDALRRLQAETRVELNALLPSVLDRAFKAEL